MVKSKCEIGLQKYAAAEATLRKAAELNGNMTQIRQVEAELIRLLSICTKNGTNLQTEG
jgi:hypothetical protein